MLAEARGAFGEGDFFHGKILQESDGMWGNIFERYGKIINTTERERETSAYQAGSFFLGAVHQLLESALGKWDCVAMLGYRSRIMKWRV